MSKWNHHVMFERTTSTYMNENNSQKTIIFCYFWRLNQLILVVEYHYFIVCTNMISNSLDIYLKLLYNQKLLLKKTIKQQKRIYYIFHYLIYHCEIDKLENNYGFDVNVKSRNF